MAPLKAPNNISVTTRADSEEASSGNGMTAQYSDGPGEPTDVFLINGTYDLTLEQARLALAGR